MYSIVLMAAIGGGSGAPGADQPGAVAGYAAPHVVVGGCTGCSGYSGCTGCSGVVSSCYGSCHGRVGLFHRHACTGCGGGVAYTSCHGCGGGFLGHHHSCHGCSGSSCHGSCSGFGAGCWGSCTGYGGGCTGSVYGSYVHPAYAVPAHTYAAPYSYPGTVPYSTPTFAIPAAQLESKKSGASLKFSVPAGAALFVDGRKTPGEGTERAFFTPALEAGQKYFYDVRAEIAIDGKVVVEEKRVVVEAGAQISESFPKVIAALAAKATVAGK